ncbi:MAG TPA: ATP-binding protein [Polyangiales bacterium]
MEKLELNAFGLRAMLDTARAELGATAVNEMAAALGVSLERVTGKDAWVSMAFVEGFMTEMVRRSGDPQIIDRFSAASISPRYLGVIYPLFRAFGSPALVYDQVVHTGPRFNKVGRYSLLERKPGFVRLDYRPVAGAPRDSTAWFCRSRQAQLACAPRLFGLDVAQVAHPSCLARGDDSCIYELRWHVPKGQWLSWAGAAVGVLTGVIAAAVGGSHAPLGVFVVCSSGLAGWASAHALRLRHSRDESIHELRQHHDALKQSVGQNEERFAELLAAKAEVDQKVEARTHQLQLTSDTLSETLQQVQALDRAKTDFFNNVSHELRTPLTLILAPLDDLVAGREPAGGRQPVLEAMQRNAVRLLRLVNQLLDLAKVEAGKMTLARVPTDVVVFARGVVQVFEGAAQRKQVKLAFEPVGQSVLLSLDTRWIESALTNLLANAMHFVHDGGRIRVRVLDRGADVVIEVEDDGPGMSAADARYVFERFAQADEGSSGRHGTGLGLPIVREAARLHGGEVSVDSQLGHGSTFRLTLPRIFETESITSALAPVQAVLVGGRPGEQPVAPLEHAQEPRVEHASEAMGAGPLLLVVEDNPDLRSFIANVLAKHFRVRTAENGAQALRLALQEPPELIVSDVAMPQMDGLQLCRRVRAERALTGTPIILLTARSETSEVLRGFDAGASDYVIKPFHARELLARVEVHVQLRRLLRDTTAHGRLAMLGLVAASVAHQVRNPLTALASGLPAMRARLKDSVDGRMLELLDTMVECAGRIERLTTDLLDVSRVDREEQVSFAPGKSLLVCARLAGPGLVSSGIRIHEAVDVETQLAGRPGDIHHAILNLLDNAARAIDGAGELELNGYVRDGSYVIEIGDSGPGVQVALRQQIFEPFWTSRPAGQGTGLGLAIAKQLVTEHGGAIEVGDSRLGGALFSLTLPLGEQAVRSLPSEREARQSAHP